MIKGVKIKELVVHEDERGNFREVIKLSEGFLENVKQISLSKTKPGVIKAFHWHKYQDEIHQIVSGKLIEVLYDARPDSITKGEIQTIFMDEKNPKMVFIPKGVYHGYKILGDKDAEVLYIMDKEYDTKSPDEERVSHDNPEINFNWDTDFENLSEGIKKKVLVIGSEGNLGTQLLKDLSKFFYVSGTCNEIKKENLIHLNPRNSFEVETIIKNENPDIIVIASEINAELGVLEDNRDFSSIERIKNIVKNSQNRKVVFYSTNFSESPEEEIIKEIPNHLIIKFPELYGKAWKNSKFIDYVISKLSKEEEIKMPVNIFGNPILISDISSATLSLLEKNKQGIYPIANPKSYSLYEIALKIADVFEFDSSLITPSEEKMLNSKIQKEINLEKEFSSEEIKIHSLDEGLKKIKDYRKKHKFKEVCMICGNENLTPYLDLGRTPLANNLINKEEISEEDVFPLQVCLCPDCFHSQLNVVVDPEILFRNYNYRSSISNSFQQHCEELALELNDSKVISENELIIDIASNDGALLKKFKEKGNRVLGIDPAKNLAKIANASGIKTIDDYLNPKLANKIVETEGHAKIITAFNVFAHVKDKHSFLRSAKILLHKKGYFIIEFPHLLHLIEKNEFDTVYHEHLSYFLIKPLKKLAYLHGLRIAKVKETHIHGGSIRIYLEHQESEDTSDGSVERLIQKEEFAGLYNKETYLKFGEKVERLKCNLISTLLELKKQGKTIAGFGASAKGNTLLNYFGIDKNIVDYIVDDTPEKQGKLSPGVHIPIVSREHLEIQKPDYLILLAWNFAEEIISKTKDYKEKGGRYIIPIPEVEII